MMYWKEAFGSTGALEMLPAAICLFCEETAEMTSLAVILFCDIFVGSIQIRIAKSEPNSCTLPTPLMDFSSSR